MARSPKAAQPAPTTPGKKASAPTAEIGVSGLAATRQGYVYEEWLPDLAGQQGQQKYRQMADNDPTIAAALSAIGLVLRAVEWRADPKKDATNADAAKEEADWLKTVFDDMSHTWEDFIAECLTMLVFGWSYFEIVYKRRVGPDERDPAKRSKATDGLMGIRKLAPRAQESLERWVFDEDGGVGGMIQRDPQNGALFEIPIQRSLLFRTTSRKNNPEGVSVLRSAYRPWYFHTKIQECEAIGIERELAGLPVVSIPSSLLTSTNPDDIRVKGIYEKIAKDLRFNQQGGLLIPSDVWADIEGNPGTARKVMIDLIASSGSRSIDTDKVKTGYQRDMARSVLADFLMLGTDKGAYNLSESKTNLFLKTCEAFADGVAAVINRFCVPRLWAINAKDPENMPTWAHGRLTPADLAVLGKFLTDISSAGATVFPDEELENFLRVEAELPEKTEEALAQQEEQRDDELEREIAAIAAAKKEQAGAEPPGAGA